MIQVVVLYAVAYAIALAPCSPTVWSLAVSAFLARALIDLARVLSP